MGIGHEIELRELYSDEAWSIKITRDCRWDVDIDVSDADLYAVAVGDRGEQIFSRNEIAEAGGTARVVLDGR